MAGSSSLSRSGLARRAEACCIRAVEQLSGQTAIETGRVAKIMDDGSVRGSLPRSRARRALLKVALGLGMSLPLVRAAGGQDADARKARPQKDDRFVFRDGAREGQIVALADLRSGGPPITAYPIDPRTKIIAQRLAPEPGAADPARPRRPRRRDARPRRPGGGRLLGRVHPHRLRHLGLAGGDQDHQVSLSLLDVRRQGRSPRPRRPGAAAASRAATANGRRRAGRRRRLRRAGWASSKEGESAGAALCGAPSHSEGGHR